MNLVFLGPPGAGKGTIAQKIMVKYSLPHISTGELFRKAIRKGTPLGDEVESVLAAGKLVTDDITIEMVRRRLNESDTLKGFILDGFPRTIVQGEALLKLRHIDHVINFILDEKEIVKRLSGRRIAKSSGRTYHLIYNPPKVEGVDDETGEPLVQRDDDKEESIIRRLKIYDEQTAPLIAFFRERSLLRDVDAHSAPEIVLMDVIKAIGLSE
ncbi:MAG: adenylate kinase [Spirochaetales bacterium]|nr:adenylate kinase [Spirochaetales bacterium]